MKWQNLHSTIRNDQCRRSVYLARLPDGGGRLFFARDVFISLALRAVAVVFASGPVVNRLQRAGSPISPSPSVADRALAFRTPR